MGITTTTFPKKERGVSQKFYFNGGSDILNADLMEEDKHSFLGIRKVLRIRPTTEEANAWATGDGKNMYEALLRDGRVKPLNDGNFVQSITPFIQNWLRERRRRIKQMAKRPREYAQGRPVFIQPSSTAQPISVNRPTNDTVSGYPQGYPQPIGYEEQYYPQTTPAQTPKTMPVSEDYRPLPSEQATTEVPVQESEKETDTTTSARTEDSATTNEGAKFLGMEKKTGMIVGTLALAAIGTFVYFKFIKK